MGFNKVWTGHVQLVLLFSTFSVSAHGGCAVGCRGPLFTGLRCAVVHCGMVWCTVAWCDTMCCAVLCLRWLTSLWRAASTPRLTGWRG